MPTVNPGYGQGGLGLDEQQVRAIVTDALERHKLTEVDPHSQYAKLSDIPDGGGSGDDITMNDVNESIASSIDYHNEDPNAHSEAVNNAVRYAVKELHITALNITDTTIIPIPVKLDVDMELMYIYGNIINPDEVEQSENDYWEMRVLVDDSNDFLWDSQGMEGMHRVFGNEVYRTIPSYSSYVSAIKLERNGSPGSISIGLKIEYRYIDGSSSS